MARIEVGVEGRQVVMLITVLAGDGDAYLTRVPLSADEARDLVNGLGESIRHVASAA